MNRFTKNPTPEYSAAVDALAALAASGGDTDRAFADAVAGHRRDLFLAQPYDFGWAHLAAMVDVCRKHGLEAQISADHSWHFPGWTGLIAVTRAGEFGRLWEWDAAKESA